MSGGGVLRLDAPGLGRPLRVGLLDEEPAGVIATRTAGGASFAASLEWPPGWEGETSVLHLLPAAGPGLRSSLRESAGSGGTEISGELRALEEETLRAAVGAALRCVSEVAAVREAALSTRVLRAACARYPDPEAVQALSRSLWRGGVRVGFGPCWSPAIPEADVQVGCRGARRRLREAIRGVASVGAAG